MTTLLLLLCLCATHISNTAPAPLTVAEGSIHVSYTPPGGLQTSSAAAAASGSVRRRTSRSHALDWGREETQQQPNVLQLLPFSERTKKQRAYAQQLGESSTSSNLQQQAPNQHPWWRSLAATAATAAAATAPQDEAKVLLQLKAYLDPYNSSLLIDWGPHPVAPESSRAARASHCTWVCVSCGRGQSVTRLSLMYLGLEGRLPPGTLLAKLPALTDLFLGGNDLQGTLPADWAALTRLRQIHLSDNHLEGPLPPQWGSFSTLKALSLSFNRFTGPLPPTWGKLSGLKLLALNDNLLSGRIPPSWAGLSNASSISLWNNNNLTGCLPQTWAGAGASRKGILRAPTGAPTRVAKVAATGTAISGFCPPTPPGRLPGQQPPARSSTQAAAAGAAAAAAPPSAGRGSRLSAAQPAAGRSKPPPP